MGSVYVIFAAYLAQSVSLKSTFVLFILLPSLSGLGCVLLLHLFFFLSFFSCVNEMCKDNLFFSAAGSDRT